MSIKKKGFVSIGLVLTVLLGLGFYGNYKLDSVIDTVIQSGLVESVITPAPATKAGNTDKIETDKVNGSPAVHPDGSTAAPGGSTSSSTPGSTVPGSQSISPEQSAIANGVERHLGRKVDRRDILAAGTIIVNNFSWSEINYLYGTGSRGLRSKEEARQVRALLLSRLSAGDIATLTALGNKYGLKLKILDASYPIK